MTSFNDWQTSSDDRLPIYLQIIDRFKRGIVKGEMEAGARVPSIRDMAILLRVNPNTVQRAYQEMERDGVIFSKRGMGFFVTEDEDRVLNIKQDLAQTSIERFLEEMRALGLTDQQIMDSLQRGMQAKKEAHNG